MLCCAVLAVFLLVSAVAVSFLLPTDIEVFCCLVSYCISDRINHPDGKCIFAEILETDKEVREGVLITDTLDVLNA